MTTERWTLALEMPLSAWAVTLTVASIVAQWTDSGLLGAACFVALCVPWVRRKDDGA